MIALGCDPSLRSYGLAVVDTSAVGLARRVYSAHEGTLPSTVPPARFLHFQALVEDLLKKYPDIEVVGIESPAYTAGPFQSIHFGLMQFSMAAIFQARKDCVLFDPATRQFLVRKDPKLRRGKITKMDVQKYVQIDTMDPNVIDNNEADAFVIALFAARLAELRKGIITPDDLTPAEKQKFISMTRKIKTLSGVRIKKTAHIFRENSRFYEFSRVPPGSVTLPSKSAIRPDLLKYLESLEEK